MAVSAKPKPSTPAPSPNSASRQALEDELISRGGAPAGEPQVQPKRAPLTDEQKLAIEYIQLRPPTWKVCQIDETRAAIFKQTGRKVSRLAWYAEAAEAYRRQQAEELGIKYSADATEPESVRPDGRRRRS